MKPIKQYLNTLIFAIYAGLIIGFGGIVYLSVQPAALGAFLFCVGLLTIVLFNFNLFTGKVIYLVINPPSYLITLAVIWVGNFIGTFCTATAVKFTKIYDNLNRVNQIVDGKLHDNLLSAFILAVFCGVMMFVAVDAQQDNVTSSPILKSCAVFLPIVVFILSGFNHIVADMFFISLAGKWSVEAIPYAIVVTFGNACGSVLFSFGKYRLARN